MKKKQKTYLMMKWILVRTSLSKPTYSISDIPEIGYGDEEDEEDTDKTLVTKDLLKKWIYRIKKVRDDFKNTHQYFFRTIVRNL